jgi:hypothetical protein
MTYSDVRFNGSLFASQIYRQPPSPDVDQAWIDLGLNRQSSSYLLAPYTETVIDLSGSPTSSY